MIVYRNFNFKLPELYRWNKRIWLKIFRVSVFSSSSSHMSLAVILLYSYFNAARALAAVRELLHRQEVIKALKKSEVKYPRIFTCSTKVEIHG